MMLEGPALLEKGRPLVRPSPAGQGLLELTVAERHYAVETNLAGEERRREVSHLPRPAFAVAVAVAVVVAALAWQIVGTAPEPWEGIGPPSPTQKKTKQANCHLQVPRLKRASAEELPRSSQAEPRPLRLRKPAPTRSEARVVRQRPSPPHRQQEVAQEQPEPKLERLAAAPQLLRAPSSCVHTRTCQRHGAHQT